MTSPEPPFLRQLRETFRVEAAEHVQAISAGLLALEQAGEGAQRELVETVFREAHSLKGAARAVDYLEVERLCQSLEDVFARWRRGEEQPAPETVDRLQGTLDAIAAALGVIAAPPAAPVPAASKPSELAMPASTPAPAGPTEPPPVAT